jgi:adenylate kinase
MQRGALVPDEIVVPVVMAYLNRKESLESGFVLDGFPRTRAQADLLFSQVELDLVLLLDVPRNFLAYGVVEGARRACVTCATGYSDFDPPKIEGVCDRCGGEIAVRADDNAETIRKRLNVYDEQIESILPDLESKGIVEVLPITVREDEQIDDSHLKKLRGEVYWVETDTDGKARMLNLEGMRKRLYGFLAMKFI